MKKVLDVGQCGADHFAIRRWIESQFDAQVVAAHDAGEALEQLRSAPCDLVLINRRLDVDGSDGLEIVRAIKADPRLSDIAVMLVSNYPQFQEQAVVAGADPGFGKDSLGAPATRVLLEKFLG